MLIRNLRKKKRIDYEESDEDKEYIYDIEKIEDIKSTSQWNDIITDKLKIKIEDINNYDDFIDKKNETFDEILNIPEWKDAKWLENVNINNINVNNKIKTLISKIKYIYIAKNKMNEMYVDGFMDSLLHILGFDDYPCLLYPQYEYFANIGRSDHGIIAKTDFSVITEKNKVLIIIEDKTMNNASYSNNWKEDQILGELFVAVHNIVSNGKVTNYPLCIYGIRVVGTLFTFYKTEVGTDYIKETAKKIPINNEMKVLRYPPVEDNPSKLTAYDICNIHERNEIIKCMISIKIDISS